MNKMPMEITRLTFLLIFTQLIIPAEATCIGAHGFNSPSSIEKLASDCALQKNLAQDELVQNEHRKNVYEKLAEKLATQIKQNSENMSLLTTFYNSNGQDLLMNSTDIAQSCRLDSIKKIENCNGVKTGAFQEMKLLMLKKKLPTNSQTPFKEDKSLFGIMSGKFYSDLGMKEQGSDKQCPVEGQAGSFMLKSQLDELSATNIINILTKLTSNNYKDFLFNNYPQLKMIQNTQNLDFINKFKLFAKNKPTQISAKEYISSFFFNPENQKILAPTIAKQCRSMNENLNRFLCSDLTELGSLDNETSQSLFNKLNTTESMEDQYEVDFNDPSVLSAYGMQCIAKENKLRNPNLENAPHFQSTDQWYKHFTNNTREEESLHVANSSVNEFCSMYTCQTPLVKNENSCKNGGPLSSSELSHSLGCDLNPKGELCLTESLKAISYMEGLEKLKQGSKALRLASKSENSSSSNANDSAEEKMVSGRLPNFAENYFGVEGSLKALGRPLTYMEVTEKKREFAENKLVSTEPVYSAPNAIKAPAPRATVATSPEAANVQTTFRPMTNLAGASSPSAPNASPNDIQTTKAKVNTPPKAKASSTNAASAASIAESTRIREEMEKMLADIKSTKQEMAVAQNNISSAGNPTSLSGASSTGPQINTRAEQERLRRLEQSLNEKANRLEDYRRELDNRNFAQNGFGPDAAAARAPGNIPQNANGNDGANGTSDSSLGPGNSLKLSSTTNPKLDDKSLANNYTTAIVQSGIESSPLTVDQLSKLSPENLTKLGIDSSRPFTLKVTFNNKTYEIPVKSFVHKGEKFLGPIMDPKNKDLNDFLLKSPIFKKYKELKLENEDLLMSASL